MSDWRENLRGILFMTAAMLALTLNFAFVKMVSPALPTGEILFLRGLIAGGLIGIAVVATGRHRVAGCVLHRTVLWRTVCESASAVSYFAALFRMPIANATVLYQALPLALAVAAALFLGERVHRRRWLAILVGFAGVLIVIRPGASEYGAASLLMMLAVLFSVGRDVATRSMPSGIPTLLVTMVGLIGLALVGLTAATFEAWVVPDLAALSYLTIASALLVVGLSCLVAAMRAGELSVIGPFRYSSVVWAVGLDYLIWGRLIDGYMAVGALVIVASGMYVSYPARPSLVEPSAAAAGPDAGGPVVERPPPCRDAGTRRVR